MSRKKSPRTPSSSAATATLEPPEDLEARGAIAADSLPDPTDEPTYTTLPVSSFVPSPTQPRRILGDLDELADSIRKHGVLEPVIARRLPSGAVELISGQRRLAAAKLAGLDEIPAIVRVLDDRQALEVQIIENRQRADVHPLEEADAFGRLHDEFRVPVAEIAAKVGKSTSYVHQRLRLRALGPTARTAFLEGRMLASVALLLARIDDPETREKATKDLTDSDGEFFEQWRWQLEDTGWTEGEPVPLGAATQWVEETYMLDLERAAFDPLDAELVPNAGACATCPKMSGNQKSLFPDVRAGSLCTDKACFQRKVDATWRQKVESAQAKGHRVLEGAEAKKVVKNGQVDRAYVDLADTCYEDSKHRTYGELIGAKGVQIHLLRDERGKVRELVRKEDAIAAGQKARMAWATPNKSPSAEHQSWQERQRAEEQKRKRERQVAKRTAEILVQAAEDDRLEETALWRIVARAFVVAIWAECRKGIIERRGVPIGKAFGADTRALTELVDQLADNNALPRLRALALELALSQDVHASHGSREVLKIAAAAGDVDMRKLARDLAAAEKKPKTTASPATKPGTNLAAGGTKPTKRESKRNAPRRTVTKSDSRAAKRRKSEPLEVGPELELDPMTGEE
jgi:ParB/RepB/Spo0J family partition protein